MDHDEAMRFLNERGMFSIKLGLERIRKLLESLGNPQDRYKTIHVAGTNGKGSVCMFIASILLAQGYKVGIYTSPYLINYEERVLINGKKMPKDDTVRLLQGMLQYIKDQTYFEIGTALAFSYFAEQEVDFAVIETGLGGRLDATNVIMPEVSVITNIGLEHIRYLGTTIEAIASEKAAIIKKGALLVTAAQGKALDVIKKRCVESGCRMYHVDLVNISRKDIEKLFLNKGLILKNDASYQKKNALIALKTIEALKDKGYAVSDPAIKKGLSDAYWPGRFDMAVPGLLLDCAHNADGAKVLADELLSQGYRDLVMVISIMRDKDIEAMCREFERAASFIIVTRAKTKRAADPKDIALNLSVRHTIIDDADEAIKYGIKHSPEKRVVVAGSIYLIGEVLEASGIRPF